MGDRAPQAVTADDIAGILRNIEAGGRSPNTVRTHWVMVRAFFAWLVTAGVLDKSPAAFLSLSVDPAQDRVREIVVPDFVFLELLYRQLGTPEDRLIFELLLGTGGRRSEVAGMRIGDVDLVGKKVWVRQPVIEVEGKLVRSRTTKGGHARSVIIGPQLAAGLKEHIARRSNPAPDEPLFTSPEGGPIRWPNYITRRLRPAVQSAATRWAALERRKLMAQGWSRADATAQALAQAAKLRRLTPHHLRHTAAAPLLWAAGVSDIEVQLILGHADIETSRRLYAHLLSGSAENAAARVEQLRQSRRTLGTA